MLDIDKKKAAKVLVDTLQNINSFIKNQEEVNEDYLDRLQLIEDKLLYIMDCLEVIEYRINHLDFKSDKNVSDRDG